MDAMKKRKLDENGLVILDQDPLSGVGITVEDARKILEPFTHDQLLEIAQTALLRHVDVLESVRSIADRDPAQRKLFIRGLGWDTTTEKLRALFAQYGELEEAVVILDKVTGKSKGYGFVTFKHIDGALQALKQPSKQIDGRVTVTQLASARASGGPVGGVGNNPVDVSERKIYVANVPYDMPAERLLAHFTMYGEIEEGPLGFDKETGKSKGFALFVYKTAEAARASLVDPVKNIDGHQLNCKLAIDGKKGKPGMGGAGGGNGVHNNGGLQTGTPAQFGGYPGYPGVGNSGGGVGVPGMSGIANQAPGSTLGGSGGAGYSASYGGASHYGGPAPTGYGGLSGPPGGLGGLGSGVGGAGRGSFFGPPPSSGGLSAGDYQPNGPYNLPSAGYQSQHHQPGTSPAPRVPTGGMYQGGHPYY